VRSVAFTKLVVGLFVILLAGGVSLAGRASVAPSAASPIGVSPTCNLDPGFSISLPDAHLDPDFLLPDLAPAQPGDPGCPQVVPLR
jgi:hypothetical protein